MATDRSLDDCVGSNISLIASLSVARRVVREISQPIKQERTLLHAVAHQMLPSMFISIRSMLLAFRRLGR